MVVWVVVAWTVWQLVADKQLFAAKPPTRGLVVGTTSVVIVGSISAAVFGRSADVDQ